MQRLVELLFVAFWFHETFLVVGVKTTTGFDGAIPDQEPWKADVRLLRTASLLGADHEHRHKSQALEITDSGKMLADRHMTAEDSQHSNSSGRNPDRLLQVSQQVWQDSSTERTTSQAQALPSQPDLAAPDHGTLIFSFEVLIATFAVVFFVSSWRQDLQQGLVGGVYLTPKFVALVAYLGLVVCTDLATKREADRYNSHRHTLKPLFIVLCVEMGKLLFSFCIEFRYPEQNYQASWGEIRKVASSLTPVALLYAANNTLTFMLMATTFLDTYVTWRNMSVVISAVLWMMTFQQMLPFNRLGAIFLVFIGMWCNSLQLKQGELPWGILASSLLSVGASVLNERAIKAPEVRKVSINVLNMLMYAQTVLAMSVTSVVAVCLSGALNYTSLLELCHSMTSATLIVVLCQVALGIVISRVLKHADSVSKTMVGALKEVLVVGIGSVVVESIHRDRVALGGSVVASVACLFYFAKEAPQCN